MVPSISKYKIVLDLFWERLIKIANTHFNKKEAMILYEL
jgi:hypothetical protein